MTPGQRVFYRRVQRSHHWYEHLVEWALRGTAAFAVILLIGLFLFLLKLSVPAFTGIPLREFFFGTVWNPTSYDHPLWGTGALVAGTLIVTGVALFIAVPMGLCTAVYLTDVAPRSMREIIKPVLEMIACIPSVVLGLLGILFVAPIMARVFGLTNGLNALTAAVLVAIAALPTMASVSEDAIVSVPKGLRDASLALGASPSATLWHVVVPAARSGILAAGMLTLGRIIGETMIVLMVAGNSLAFPRSLLDPVRPMTAAVAIEMKETVTGSLHWHSLFAIGFTLFCMTFILNAVADLFMHRRAP